MSQLPRGWTYTNAFGAGQTPSLTLPAIPGVSHILTDAYLAVYSGAAAPPSGYNVFLAFNGGGLAVFLGVITLGTLAFAKDEISESGLSVTAGPNTVSSVSAGGAIPANMGSLLILKGYDV